MAGMRKSTFFKLICDEGEASWELHLRADSKKKSTLFGYIVNRDRVLSAIIRTEQDVLLKKKLPLVLDIDDTIDRVVGKRHTHFLPASVPEEYGPRLRVLREGTTVVLSEDVVEFLNWASTLFDLSLCSLGDQAYVDGVGYMLNHEIGKDAVTTMYSARPEHDHLTLHPPRRGETAKDLSTLFSYCGIHLDYQSRIPVSPLIIDDSPRVWPHDQSGQIIHVRNEVPEPNWNVKFLPDLKIILKNVHRIFYEQVRTWNETEPSSRGPAPSVARVYQEFVGERADLAKYIVETTQ
ncbi:hypothetical protein HK104_007277 [Borealophlyctis nickersoniae]|nr:hypothetical protein HK104_007277 [Borealophlyctis nickersoniae]